MFEFIPENNQSFIVSSPYSYVEKQGHQQLMGVLYLTSHSLQNLTKTDQCIQKSQDQNVWEGKENLYALLHEQMHALFSYKFELQRITGFLFVWFYLL